MTAKAHCARGASIWEWASTDDGDDPDVVLACAGDVPTLETVAAAWWLRQHAPELRVRVVNVVDLMTLFPPDVHPHGMSAGSLRRAVHRGPSGRVRVSRLPARDSRDRARPSARRDRFHVRGFNEQGTTTTPFSMVAMNGMSRYHLARLALERTTRVGDRAGTLIERCDQELKRADEYARAHFEDPPEITNWTWEPPAAEVRS